MSSLRIFGIELCRTNSMGGLRDFDVETPWVDSRAIHKLGASSWVSDEVIEFVAVLKRQWLLYNLCEDLPPTCWPFIIPKT